MKHDKTILGTLMLLAMLGCVILWGQHKTDMREITRLEGEIVKFKTERTQIDRDVRLVLANCMASYARNPCIRGCVEVDYETPATP